ncbi:MAG: hypothetical protein M3245_02075 [Actinomycetota bacterium]|nr:hypothetical protein [Actinomycetota bacterium]
MRKSRSGRRVVRILSLVLLVVLAFGSNPVISGAQSDRAPDARIKTQRGSTTPEAVKGMPKAKALSPIDEMRLERSYENARAEAASRVPAREGPPGPPLPAARQSHEDDAGRFHGAPGQFVTGRLVENARARTTACGAGSTLAEPAAANEGRHVFYTGNLRHREFSTDGGTTWTCANAYTAGPAEAPTPFGDTEVVYDPARGVTFNSVMYVGTNAGGNIVNGVLRLFVRRNMNLNDSCSYTIDVNTNSTTELPDYPHIGLSNNWLYISANRLNRAPGGGWVGAHMRRYNVDQLSDCVTAAFESINLTGSVGQRILIPGHGARDVMYFGWAENTTQVRMFSWADAPGSAVLQNLLGVSTLTFGDPVCRGGTNNADWTDNLTSAQVGFGNATAIGNDYVSYWISVASDASHPQAHIHGAVWRIGATQNSYALVQQPVVWNSANCAALPAAATNGRGDIALAFGYGSNKTGGTSASAVHTDVLIKDQFSPGPGGFLFVSTGAGTQNPIRYGDYFTVRPHSPDGLFFSATGYAHAGSPTVLDNVRARYMEFGRGRDYQGYLAWRNAIPAT